KSNLQNQALSLLYSSHERQVTSILPSFLIPEQSAGIDLLLRQMKEDEELEEIKIIPIKENLINEQLNNWHSCEDKKNIKLCRNFKNATIAAFIPIKVADNFYGTLMKIKKIHHHLLDINVLLSVIVLALTLLGCQIGLIFATVKITSVNIPNSVNILL